MTWKELGERISKMTEEEQLQEVAIWGEDFTLRNQDCFLTKTDEALFFNDNWDETYAESDLLPEDLNHPDTCKVCEKGMYYIFG